MINLTKKIKIIIAICLFAQFYMCFHGFSQTYNTDYDRILDLVTEVDFKNYIKQNIAELSEAEGIYVMHFKIERYLDDEFYDEENFPELEDSYAILRISDIEDYIMVNISNSKEGEADSRKIEFNSNFNELFTNNPFGDHSRFCLNKAGNFESIKKISWEEYCQMFGVPVNNPHRYRMKAYQRIDFVKIFPSDAESRKYRAQQDNLRKKSATGFALFSDGVIATSNHVVENAKIISVSGINGDFNRRYKCKVIVADSKNDLALIKVDSLGSENLGKLPYELRVKGTVVGENIFVLGYPLKATMGEEIKLTTGIISSLTGFQGDITSFQISAAIQPGNSGSPLFDIDGNIIGIINAKHGDAENASYAIKASYLTNLADFAGNYKPLLSDNSLEGMALSKQVQEIKKYVYIIETEY